MAHATRNGGVQHSKAPGTEVLLFSTSQLHCRRVEQNHELVPQILSLRWDLSLLILLHPSRAHIKKCLFLSSFEELTSYTGLPISYLLVSTFPSFLQIDQRGTKTVKPPNAIDLGLISILSGCWETFVKLHLVSRFTPLADLIGIVRWRTITCIRPARSLSRSSILALSCHLKLDKGSLYLSFIHQI